MQRGYILIIFASDLGSVFAQQTYDVEVAVIGCDMKGGSLVVGLRSEVVM